MTAKPCFENPLGKVHLKDGDGRIILNGIWGGRL
jgi:hypothetical protein